MSPPEPFCFTPVSPAGETTARTAVPPPTEQLGQTKPLMFSTIPISLSPVRRQNVTWRRTSPTARFCGVVTRTQPSQRSDLSTARPGHSGVTCQQHSAVTAERPADSTQPSQRRRLSTARGSVTTVNSGSPVNSVPTGYTGVACQQESPVNRVLSGYSGITCQPRPVWLQWNHLSRVQQSWFGDQCTG